MDFAFKHGFFASKVFSIVVRRECHSDVCFVARFHANQTFFETRDELTGAKNKRVAFCRATVKCFAVNFAQEVEYNLIAVFRL